MTVLRLQRRGKNRGVPKNGLVSRHPGSPGLEEDMSNPFRYAIVVAAVLLAVLVAAPACQCQSEEPTKHEIFVESDKDGDPYQWMPIKTITVQSGDTIRITVKEDAAWFLIPDDRFTLLEGGCEWVASKSFTAFKVKEGFAVLRLDECDSGAEAADELHYSVLVQNANGKWDYVHGNNPPPGMIVPPRKR